MNYDELPIEERIQKASEYALILSGEERVDVDIIEELKSTFKLNEAQAQEAYELMRKNYRKEFRSEIRSKINRGWALVFGIGAISIFYALFTGFLGWPVLIVVFLLGLAGVQTLINIAKWYREKSSPVAEDLYSEVEKKLKAKKGDKYEPPISYPVFFLFILLVIFFIFYTKQTVVDVSKVVGVNKMVVDGKVERKRTGAKGSSHYLLFHFKGYSHFFNFHDYMYDYGRWKISKDDFKPGDTLSIEISNTEQEELEHEDHHNIAVLNISQNGSWLVDHEDRNKRVKKTQKIELIVVSGAFLVCCIAVFLWTLFYRRTKKII